MLIKEEPLRTGSTVSTVMDRGTRRYGSLATKKAAGDLPEDVADRLN